MLFTLVCLRTTGSLYNNYHYYYFDFALSRFVGGMAAEHGVVNLLLVGHSLVRRLGNYALSAGEMNMNLNEGDCAVSFIGKGGMSVHQLRSHFDEIVSRGPDVLYVEIGTIDISGRDPLDLADEVFELARSFSARGVRRVVIAQIFVLEIWQLAAAIPALRQILTNVWSRTIYACEN